MMKTRKEVKQQNPEEYAVANYGFYIALFGQKMDFIGSLCYAIVNHVK